jgi:ferredoxin
MQLRFSVSSSRRAPFLYALNSRRCIFCSNCSAVCPVLAISQIYSFDFSFTARSLQSVRVIFLLRRFISRSFSSSHLVLLLRAILHPCASFSPISGYLDVVVAAGFSIWPPQFRSFATFLGLSSPSACALSPQSPALVPCL